MLLDRATKHTDALEPELKFIISLKSALEIYCKGKENSIKNVMLREFALDLGNIVALYENRPKKMVFTKLKAKVDKL